jgi:hypothetical protein
MSTKALWLSYGLVTVLCVAIFGGATISDRLKSRVTPAPISATVQSPPLDPATYKARLGENITKITKNINAFTDAIAGSHPGDGAGASRLRSAAVQMRETIADARKLVPPAEYQTLSSSYNEALSELDAACAAAPGAWESDDTVGLRAVMEHLARAGRIMNDVASQMRVKGW